jgi:hypothetical protein
MTDIVWSLKAAASHPDAGPGTCRVLIAEVLEAVAEIERLRSTLKAVIDFTGAHGGPFAEARRALEGK